MPSQNKSFLVLFAMISGLAFFPLAMPASFHIDEAKLEIFETFPYQLGDWMGKDYEIEERTYEILETRNVLSRVYQNPAGERVHLLLVGSRKDRRVAHPPEVCYLGSNYSITDETGETLNLKGQSIPVREFVAKHERTPNQKENVLYLYKVGDEFTENYYSQQIRFAVDRIKKRESEVLLIRLSGSNKELFSGFLAEVISKLQEKI